MATTVKIKIENRIAVCVENHLLTSMNTGDSILFEFDSEWNPENITASRTARFKTDDVYIDIPFNGNVCPLPSFTKYGNIFIGVFWGDIKTTDMAKITYNPSVASEIDFPDDPPNEVYNRILELMNQKVNTDQLQSEIKKGIIETQLIEKAESYITLKPEISKYHLISGAAVGIKCEDFYKFPLGYCATVAFFNPYTPSLLETFKIETDILNDYSDNGLPLSELKIGCGTNGTVLFIYKCTESGKFHWYLSTAEKRITQEQIDSSVKEYLTENPVSDGHTPIRGKDYWTEEDKSEIQADNIDFITNELAKRGQLKPEFANNTDECADTSKLYVLPDGYIYAYTLTEKEVESGPNYTNLLPLAINTDGTTYVGTNGEKGYKTGWRINSSNTEKESSANCMTGYIPVKENDVIRIKNIEISANTNGYFHWYKSDFSVATSPYYENTSSGQSYVTAPDSEGLIEFNAPNVEAIAYFRMTTGVIDDTTIITVNEEITEGNTEIITEYGWVNTGHAFVSADYQSRITQIENEVAQNSTDIENLKDRINSPTPIKDWDVPIYDAHIPVFELPTEKTAITKAEMTPDSIYAKYDALMEKHPKYITKTDLGLCSDGINHIYRYDFKEPEPLHESNKVWSETKAKAIIITGIHYEWAGIYAMYNALEEIANNPNLRSFRRNTHFIVVPVSNPYATIAENYQSGLSTPNSHGVRNANGVEIHRNFEVDWVLTAADSAHYGGAEPLSEVETQYIDGIMKTNTDAALFLSCHNCGVDGFWGTGFIWSSTATKYMCNMAYRLIDKMSDAWMDKYGETLSIGIEEYKTDIFEEGNTRLGWAGLSTTPATEAKQAAKYGIQGTNVEICDPFQIHGTKSNPEQSMSSFTMSRGAEVYINFLLTALGVYDHKDKLSYK